MFVDNENTSSEVDQHVNEDSSENIIQGIFLSNSKYTHFFAKKHINIYPFLYMVCQ